MSKVITTELQHSGASSANITLDSSKNVTVENNLTVDGTTTLTGAVTLPAGTTSDTLPFRNLVINGDMQVAQRGTSATTNGYGTVDRFTCQYGGQDEVLTQEQVSLTSSDTGPWAKGFRKAFKITNGNQSSGAGGDDYAQTIYHFEGQDINTSGWDFTDPNSKITVSFWAKSSVAQTFNLRFRAYATEQQEYYTSFALSANTWTKVTKTIPGHADLAGIPSDNGGQLFMVFQYYYGTNLTGTQTENAWHAKDTANTYPDMTTTWWTTNDATFHLTGVQLEVADTATEFENRTYADQLLRCQRYFWMYYYPTANAKSLMVSHNWHTNQIFGHINFPCRMRSAPSGVVTNGTDYWTVYKTTPNTSNFDTMSQWNANENSAILEGMSPSVTAGESGFCTGNNASASFAFNAEL